MSISNDIKRAYTEYNILGIEYSIVDELLATKIIDRTMYKGYVARIQRAQAIHFAMVEEYLIDNMTGAILSGNYENAKQCAEFYQKCKDTIGSHDIDWYEDNMQL